MTDCRPSPDLWAAWDNLNLTVDGTQLVGWWANKPAVTVNEGKTASQNVYASCYIRPSQIGGGVIAIANWDNDHAITVDLQIDWAQLGLTAETATITAPAINNFQPSLSVDPSKFVLSDEIACRTYKKRCETIDVCFFIV